MSGFNSFVAYGLYFSSVIGMGFLGYEFALEGEVQRGEISREACERRQEYIAKYGSEDLPWGPKFEEEYSPELRRYLENICAAAEMRPLTPLWPPLSLARDEVFGGPVIFGNRLFVRAHYSISSSPKRFEGGYCMVLHPDGLREPEELRLASITASGAITVQYDVREFSRLGWNADSIAALVERCPWPEMDAVS